MPPQIEQTLTLDQHDNIEQSLPDSHHNIFNIRKYLLILLFLQWFICVLTLAVGIYSVFYSNAADISSGIQSLIPIIIFAFFYTFGLLVTYKQYRIGLLIFASIGIILFIAIFILLGYIILAITALGIGFGNTNQTYEFIVFIGILFVLIAIVAITSIKFSFDLAKSIKTQDYSTV